MLKAKSVKKNSDSKVTAVFQGKGISQNYSSNDLKGRNSIVLISVIGNKYYKGNFFNCIVKDSLKQFSRVLFLLVDEPNKYNISNTPDQAETEAAAHSAIKLGDAWFTENENSFRELFVGIPDIHNHLPQSTSTVDEKIKRFNELSQQYDKHFEIQRWQNWVSGKELEIQRLKASLSKVPSIASAINEEAAVYVKRRRNHESDRLDLSKRYLTEETVGVTYVGMLKGYDFVAYPGKLISPFEKVFEYFYQNVYLLENSDKSNFSCLHWLYINFKQFKLQKEIDEPVKSDLEVSAIMSEGCVSSSQDFYFALVLGSVELARDDLIEQGFPPEEVKALSAAFLEKVLGSLCVSDQSSSQVLREHSQPFNALSSSSFFNHNLTQKKLSRCIERSPQLCS